LGGGPNGCPPRLTNEAPHFDHGDAAGGWASLFPAASRGRSPSRCSRLSVLIWLTRPFIGSPSPARSTAPSARSGQCVRLSSAWNEATGAALEAGGSAEAPRTPSRPRMTSSAQGSDSVRCSPSSESASVSRSALHRGQCAGRARRRGPHPLRPLPRPQDPEAFEFTFQRLIKST
jgi:hypothetical protein